MTTSRSRGAASEISGKLTRIKFQKDLFVIGELDYRHTVKGDLPSPSIGVDYTFTGRWKKHPKYGDFFQFDTYITILPTDNDGIKKYLRDNCQWIGPVIAEEVVEAFGSDALETLKRNPDIVAARIKGISKKRAKEVSVSLLAQEEGEAMKIALNKLLDGLGVSARSIRQIIDKYKNDAPQVVKEDPYRLIEEINGIGFLTADKIGSKNKFKPDDPRRIRAAVFHVLQTKAMGEGHTCYPYDNLIRIVAELISVADSITGYVIDEEIEKKNLVVDGNLVYLKKYHDEERLVSLALKEILETPYTIETECVDDGLKEDQVEALKKALESKIFILAGRPGSGKTYTLKRIIESHPNSVIALAAPTGKASKRMYEMTGREASTIHRLLEPYYNEQTKEFTFGKTRLNPIRADLVVLDEVSMVDISLMHNFLEAVSKDTKLIFIGDFHQLPSVGPGNVLKDMIASGIIPCTELTTIKRQDPGDIILNCHHIINGEDIVVNNKDSKDFFFIEKSEQQDIQDMIVDLVAKRIPEKFGYHPFKDIQVITALRKRTLLSCESLNQVLQDKLNPGKSVGQYRIGDKVIQTRNDYELGIINGDIGYIVDIVKEDGIIVVDFENPDRRVQIPLGENNLELAYVITTHRFQGSEAPVIIIPIHESLGPFITQRNWLYTAISRAVKMCILVGQREEVREIIGRNKQQKRFTGLRIFLNGKQSK